MTNKGLRYLRWGLLAAILVYITVAAFLHQQSGPEKAASIHALCPYGGLETLYSLMFSGSFVKKIFSGTMVLLVLSLIITLLFRRSFCGLLCPFGALQEFFAKLGQKVLGKRYTMPDKIDIPLRYLKYLVLLITLLGAWITGTLWMSPYDPYAAYAHLSAGFTELAEEYFIGLILLVVTVIGSFVYDRFFCKYLCPAGAFYGILGKLSPNKVERNEAKCIHCRLCSKSCPVNIDVEKATTVTTAECINCQECVNVCPQNGAIAIKQGKKEIPALAVIGLVMGIFFGGILVAQATGFYKTLPAPVTEGSIVNVEEIRGSMTLADVAKGTGLSQDVLYKKLGIPENVPPETRLKDVSQYVEGFSPETARELLRQTP
ncbi:4Fe-4S binding protein [Thermincola potens]|uniref:4Fe-4S ferredoxin iron-sulfur binding domain protein n=1 Tax=Thermincola potens (strain JR) TaxID=635013 RepID=D5X939_THEPJ|nr:4Fe-4S binding protein [Thermincola potens]ADG81039.1 4Fe-4S ferredoxin iron-sulfur binding domain protein [Thermincola potens JR]